MKLKITYKDKTNNFRTIEVKVEEKINTDACEKIANDNKKNNEDIMGWRLRRTKNILVCDWYGHIYPYSVKTTGKHPVHMIEGGSYLTEEDFDNGAGDMGWFWLNSRDYEWFKNHLEEKEVEGE